MRESMECSFDGHIVVKFTPTKIVFIENNKVKRTIDVRIRTIRWGSDLHAQRIVYEENFKAG